MASSLSSLANNLAKGLHKIKYEKNKSGPEHAAVKYKALIFKCLDCDKNYEKKFNENLTKRFQNKYQFGDGDINSFCLMSWKGVFPYEYMDSWERFNETSLLAKKDFYCNLKAHRQISKKRCFEKYCSCDQAYQFSAL